MAKKLHSKRAIFIEEAAAANETYKAWYGGVDGRWTINIIRIITWVFLPLSIVMMPIIYAAIFAGVRELKKIAVLWKPNMLREGMVHHLFCVRLGDGAKVLDILQPLCTLRKVYRHTRISFETLQVLAILIAGDRESPALSRVNIAVMPTGSDSCEISIKAYKRFIAPYEGTPVLDRTTRRFMKRVEDELKEKVEVLSYCVVRDGEVAEEAYLLDTGQKVIVSPGHGEERRRWLHAALVGVRVIQPLLVKMAFILIPWLLIEGAVFLGISRLFKY
jgi:hypothetical protein